MTGLLAKRHTLPQVGLEHCRGSPSIDGLPAIGCGTREGPLVGASRKSHLLRAMAACGCQCGLWQAAAGCIDDFMPIVKHAARTDACRRMGIAFVKRA